MTETIYLILSPSKVERMVKTEKAATSLYKDELPVKVTIEVPDENWKRPYLEKRIVVNRWDKGIDVEDVHFENDFVTEQEAEMIREKRIEKMKEILEGQGYKVDREEG